MCTFLHSVVSTSGRVYLFVLNMMRGLFGRKIFNFGRFYRPLWALVRCFQRTREDCFSLADFSGSFQVWGLLEGSRCPMGVDLPCLPLKHHTTAPPPPHWLIVCSFVFVFFYCHPFASFPPRTTKWISTRSSLLSEALESTRKFCTYGFVYLRFSSPFTWWWASLPEPRHPINAGRAWALWGEIILSSPAQAPWTSACPTPASPPRVSCCKATGLSASRVATDGSTVGRLFRAPQSPRYLTIWQDALTQNKKCGFKTKNNVVLLHENRCSMEKGIQAWEHQTKAKNITVITSTVGRTHSLIMR